MQVHRKSISQTVFSIAQMIMHGTVTIFFVPGKSFRPPGRFFVRGGHDFSRPADEFLRDGNMFLRR